LPSWQGPRSGLRQLAAIARPSHDDLELDRNIHPRKCRCMRLLPVRRLPVRCRMPLLQMRQLRLRCKDRRLICQNPAAGQAPTGPAAWPLPDEEVASLGSRGRRRCDPAQRGWTYINTTSRSG
jgi:hypothetical protein